jgi:RND family efflux transporter MFP subunit
MRYRWLAGICLALGCGGAREEAPPRPEVTVRLGTVTRDSVAVVIEADGRLLSPPRGTALLAAPAAGVVREVPVELGSRVAPGTVVIRLDAPDLAAGAAALRAQVAAARTDADRQRQLLADGIASRRQVEERVAAADALVAQAEAADSLLRRTTLRSPLRGVVSQLLVSIGTQVSAGQALAEVVDPTAVFGTARVPAVDLARVRPGQKAEVRPEGSDRWWPARVSSVGAVVDSISNTGEVRLALSARDPVLRPGVGLLVRLTVDTRTGVIVVPASALVEQDNSTRVFVVGPDSLALGRVVTVGARDGARVEVTGEVHPGERIVVEGGYGLVDSTRVLPQPDSAP